MVVNNDVSKFINNINQNTKNLNPPKIKGGNNNHNNGVANTDGAKIPKISFHEILQQTVETSKTNKKLSFSKHALQRLAQRDIEINDEFIEKLNGALKKAAGKNIKNVLLLSEDAAFIVSVDNNIVVTAMNSGEMKENVITKIDGTVII